MATREAKLKIAIEGEQQYKQAVAELNRGNQVLNAEMKKLQEQYKGSESSMEAMRAKSDLLQRQLLQQKDKVQTLREALQNAAQQYGEADKRTQSWQTQLLNAERDEIKLQRALDETNKEINSQGTAMEEAGEKTKGLGDSLDSVASKLGISIPSAVKDALNGMTGFSAGTVAAMGAAAAGIGLVIKAASSLNDLTKEAAKEADALLTRSAQTGLDVGLLQGLDYAAKFLDFEGIDQALVKLTVSMDKARDGAKAQAAAFETLGISVTDADGQLRDNWETFKEVIDRLGQVENATERDALANDLFGKSFAEMKPLIAAGSEALQDYVDTAVEKGYVMTEEQARILGEVNDAYDESETKWAALKTRIAVDFAPASISWANLVGTSADLAGKKLVDSGLVKSFSSLVTSVSELLTDSTELVGKLPYWMDPIQTLVWWLDAADTAINGIKSGLDWISDNIAKYRESFPVIEDFETVVGTASLKTATNLPVITSENTSVNSGPSKHSSSTSGVRAGKIKTASRLYVGSNAAGDDSWRGGLTWVGDGGGPELVDLPRGTRIYSAQESRQIAAASVDTRRMETLLERSVALQERIYGEFSGLRVKGRMAM